MFNIDNSIRKIIGKPKRFGGRRDRDGDGIPNWKDCQPRNVMRQDKVNIFKPRFTTRKGNDVRVRLGIDNATWNRWIGYHAKYGMDTAIDKIHREFFQKYGKKAGPDDLEEVVDALSVELGSYFPTGLPQW